MSEEEIYDDSIEGADDLIDEYYKMYELDNIYGEESNVLLDPVTGKIQLHNVLNRKKISSEELDELFSC